MTEILEELRQHLTDTSGQFDDIDRRLRALEVGMDRLLRALDDQEQKARQKEAP